MMRPSTLGKYLETRVGNLESNLVIFKEWKMYIALQTLFEVIRSTDARKKITMTNCISGFVMTIRPPSDYFFVQLLTL